jgi:hypothetical protein
MRIKKQAKQSDYYIQQLITRLCISSMVDVFSDQVKDFCLHRATVNRTTVPSSTTQKCSCTCKLSNCPTGNNEALKNE